MPRHVGEEIVHGNKIEGPEVISLNDQLLGSPASKYRRTVQQRAGDRGRGNAVDHRNVPGRRLRAECVTTWP